MSMLHLCLSRDQDAMLGLLTLRIINGQKKPVNLQLNKKIEPMNQLVIFVDELEVLVQINYIFFGAFADIFY